MAGKWKSRLGAAAMLACLGLPLAAGCGRAPQLGSEDNLAAADGLWTAVTAKDASLVDKSAGLIEQLHQTHKMSDEAFEVLRGVIATARAGDWSQARGALKAFVRGQRPAEKAG